MSEPDRSATATGELSREATAFLDAEAERRAMTRAELLDGLVGFLRDAHENGLSCPHCNNELLVDL